jgi:KDO2-lipid IV(A) lauroyltransferase
MDRLAALAILASIRAFSLMPLRMQRAIGRLLGRFAWWLRIDAARVTRINLALCFPEVPDLQRDRLGRESLEQTAQLLTEAGAIFHWSESRWARLAVSIEGDDLLERALSERRGVLLLVPHLGSWEYLSLYLGRYGVTALYDPPRNRHLEGPLRAARARAGARLLPISRSGLRSLYEALGNGSLVALLPDQVPERSAGVYADFFGVPALTMTLAWRLIRREDPLVLIGVAIRTCGGFALRFLEPDQHVRSPDPAIAVAALNRAIEGLVRRSPAQYQWEYKRFKRPPPGRSDCYSRKHSE